MDWFNFNGLHKCFRILRKRYKLNIHCFFWANLETKERLKCKGNLDLQRKVNCKKGAHLSVEKKGK